MNIAVSSIKGHEPTQNFLAAKRKLLIGGKWVDAQSGKTFPVYNPADGQVIAQVAEGDKADVDLAVKAARAAFESGPWPKMAPNARAKLLWKLADALEANADEFALIETLDNGKPLKMSRLVDVAGSADRIRYYAGWATKLSGQTVDLSIPGQWHAFTLREPIGVAGPDRAVELPADDGGEQDGAGAGRRLHRDPQARRADAAFGAAPRRAHAGSGLPRGRGEHHHRLRRDRGRGHHRAPGRRQGLVHRLDRGRQADPQGRDRESEARHARARRQVADHRVPRRRYRRGGGGRRARHFLQ